MNQMSKTALQEIEAIAHHLPYDVLLDIHQRIGDWLACGGIEDDPYIHQQLRYARRFLPAVGDSDKNT